MPRALVLAFAFVMVFAGLLAVPPAPVAAVPPAQSQTLTDNRDAQAAAAAARALSRLEEAGEFADLYDRLHPDARAIVPEAAVVGWYEEEFGAKRTAELTVTGVAFVEWTWAVNGTTYPRAAAVSFVQPYWEDGARRDVADVVHLVADDGGWGWFFGGSRSFVDQQIARYAPEDEDEDDADGQRRAIAAPDPRSPAAVAARAGAFPDLLHAHVDLYWALEFADAGHRYDPPEAVVALDRPVVTGCGRADPATDTAFYCVLDETIYYSTTFRGVVEEAIGDFGWIVVVAHEWGHHVQFELGLDPSDAPARVGDFSSRELEQQADCLAGAYTRFAEGDGWLDPGDVEEALRMTELAGDPVGTPYDDPFAHGSGADRVAAYLEGYDGGLAMCGLDL